MSATPFTPGETIRLDQELDTASRELDFWVSSLRKAQAKHGKYQGLANTALALQLGADQPALLLAALVRLAKTRQEGG
jgi:hypothetical protein